MKALEGLKVLDLTRALAGPYCTLMLGDYGADVIKIEIPGSGDDTRHWGPPFIEGESAYFLSINRNKRSLTLNFKDDEAKEIFLKLSDDADVIVENFTPGVMERFGLGYDVVNSVNPRIIYTSISGFGQDGPYSRLPAYDQIMQGISGVMSLTGEPEGEPQKVGIAVSDIGAGMWAAFAIMSAIHHRTQHGKGQYIDVSMLGRPGGLAHLPGSHAFRQRKASGAVGRCPSKPLPIPGIHVPGRQVHQHRGGIRTHLGAIPRSHGPGGAGEAGVCHQW